MSKGNIFFTQVCLDKTKMAISGFSITICRTKEANVLLSAVLEKIQTDSSADQSEHIGS